MTKKQAKTKAAKERKQKVYEIEQVLKHVRPTPMVTSRLSNEKKIEIIADRFKDIMEVLGLDLSNDSLRDTPKRIAKMYVNEVFSGLNKENFPKITVIENEMDYDQMVVVQDIHVLSMCEHHFQNIHGHATVAYIPNKKSLAFQRSIALCNFSLVVRKCKSE